MPIRWTTKRNSSPITKRFFRRTNPENYNHTNPTPEKCIKIKVRLRHYMYVLSKNNNNNGDQGKQLINKLATIVWFPEWAQHRRRWSIHLLNTLKLIKNLLIWVAWRIMPRQIACQKTSQITDAEWFTNHEHSFAQLQNWNKIDCSFGYWWNSWYTTIQFRTRKAYELKGSWRINYCNNYGCLISNNKRKHFNHK